MLPENTLSTKAVVGLTSDPTKRPGDFLIDYERAGIALNDASQGMMVQVWKLEVKRDITDVTLWNVYVSAPSSPQQLLFSAPDITEASLAFDQNMRPFVAYVQAGVAKYWWYDASVPGQVHTVLGSDAKSVKCCVDEKRSNYLSNSDILLFYIRNGSLCIRYQRDRFNAEYILKAVGGNAEIVYVGMNSNLRMQIRLRKTDIAADDPQATAQTNPYLSDIVIDLCARAGIPYEKIDVNDLYGEFVVGYPIIGDEPISELIEPLSKAFFFDPMESDKKLRFLRRGREVTSRFSYQDLVESKGGAFKQTRVQEAKLSKQINVNHLDPAGGMAKNKQTAYRKSNMVKATKNTNIDLPFAVSADQGATIALQALKAQWHEQMSYEFSLPMSFTEIMPSDVVEYTDKDGNTYKIRIEEREEDTGVLTFKGRQDGGLAVYDSVAHGQSLREPISTTPGIIGESRLEILNLPVLRDQDDELGVYIAVAGETSVWRGAQVLVSTDDGANYTESFSTEVPATIGDTETEITDTVIVKVNYPLESIEDLDALPYHNRAVIGDEIIRFKTAIHLGNNRFELSDLIRGKYNTAMEAWPIGIRFVLLDSAVEFVQAQRWMMGKEIYFKAVSYGTTEDSAVPTSYDFDVAYSQLEWQPKGLDTDRNATGVAVVWDANPRLGTEGTPYESQYFTGYKVVFSDGFTAITTNTSHTREDCPLGLAVKVCGVNSITGDGLYSEIVLKRTYA